MMSQKSLSPLILMSIAAIAVTGCGKANAPGPVTLQAAPLAGPSAASISHPGGFRFASIADSLASGLMAFLLGEHSAYAAVSPFSSFKMCNDTLVMTDINGNTVAINGSTNQAGMGILAFNSASTSNTTLGSSLNIAAGTQIREIDITSAINNTLCPGMTDAVTFDSGSGPNHISQNTAFKFMYSTPLTISGNNQTLTLLFGQIVSGMVSLGGGLNNSSIQTVNVGQAQ